MKKIIIALALLLILVFAYGASPYISIYNFVKALQAGDKQTLQEHVDFPSVRASVQKQVNDTMQKSIRRNKYNPLVLVNIAVVSTVVNGMVKCILTPAGLSEVIQYGELHNPLDALKGYNIPVVAASKTKETKKDKQYNFDMIQSVGFVGLNEFRVKLIVQKNKKPVTFVFVRQDFSWLLQDIEISDILSSYMVANY